MGWNGADLITELTEQLGDTSTGFQTKTLRWLNEVQDDICTRFDWPFLKQKGKKVLVADVEEHNLFIGEPSPAVSLAAAAGGSLTDATSYRVVVTFVESSTGAETVASIASAAAITATPNLSLALSSIPVSSESLTTSRNIYLSKGAEDFYLSQTIEDNTTTTASITEETTSLQVPPDYSYIRKIDGSPFLEGSGSRTLEYVTIRQLREMFPGTWSTGTPVYWAPIDNDTISVYPVPSVDTALTFYYYKMPNRILNDSNSQPTIPLWLKVVLKEGVLAKGYEYRERDGAQQKMNNYEGYLKDFISRAGRPVKASATVRDVTGNNDGWLLT